MYFHRLPSIFDFQTTHHHDISIFHARQKHGLSHHLPTSFRPQLFRSQQSKIMGMDMSSFKIERYKSTESTLTMIGMCSGSNSGFPNSVPEAISSRSQIPLAFSPLMKRDFPSLDILRSSFVLPMSPRATVRTSRGWPRLAR
mmetsp:Transcript_23601/g.57873  ORF Transcript_23601/g.57873 Transcript_23601/m.57873 type:complete len:142 (+) Transcript_23601:1066-1491(+)